VQNRKEEGLTCSDGKKELKNTCCEMLMLLSKETKE
jgi:hypothetical protein